MADPVGVVQRYRNALRETDLESGELTILVAAGATVAQVADALEVDLTLPASEYPDPEGEDEELDEGESAWAIADVPGGVIALEHSGYADPSLGALRKIAENGRSAAVARSNIQGHNRFGCAHDGEIIFDADEYTCIEDRDLFPEAVRPVVEAVLHDRDSGAFLIDAFAAALAMAATITGMRVGPAALKRPLSSGYRRAPQFRYVEE